MRRERFSLFRLYSLVAVFSLAVFSALAAPIINLFSEAFPIESPPLDRQTNTNTTEVAERMSQTGKGVWAFVTDLFKVEGRDYLWQAGDGIA